MHEELTDRQTEILEFIVETVEEQGYPPSVRDICRRFKISSPNGAQRHLDALERKGYIKRDSKARAIRLAPDLRKRSREPSDGRSSGSESSNAVSLPLLGNVAAGTPREALQDPETTVPVPPEWVSGVPDAFLLRIKGESMAPGMQPGDLVVVRPQARADNGDLVVAVIDGEATVKRLQRKAQQTILQADNPDYDDIVVSEEFIINGKVIGLLRRY